MPIKPVTHTRPYAPELAPTGERPVRVGARDLNAAELVSRHNHPYGQLTYAIDGLMRVTVDDATWIVPPQRAIWIPPLVFHEVETLEMARLRVLRIDRSASPFEGSVCVVIDVTPLLRELILALIDCEEESPREALLAGLALDEVSRSATLPMCVPLPRDKRLRSLCDMLIADPASPFTLEEWAKKTGASSRTLARLFERELGMSFGQWRQQVRLAHAAPLIARGMPLSRVAAELGYASQSAFSAMFKKTFGQSPSSFFADALPSPKPSQRIHQEQP
ncbi:MAG TPA: helix-turn-helix transcriptional regulator [Paucimonas sp.]|nr:helix-turn-helix transcriptional regulator [Paucimonas sp.]